AASGTVSGNDAQPPPITGYPALRGPLSSAAPTLRASVRRWSVERIAGGIRGPRPDRRFQPSSAQPIAGDTPVRQGVGKPDENRPPRSLDRRVRRNSRSQS